MTNLTINPNSVFNNNSAVSTHTDDEICSILTELKMSAVRETYKEVKNSSSFMAFSLNDQLYELLQPELTKRKNNGYQKRLKQADRESGTTAAQLMERSSHYSLSRSQIDYLLNGSWFGRKR